MERGLEFYVMLAAVAVGALTWLYRKGSRVWRTVRKLRRSFREICLNPKSALDDEHCRQLAIGAMYASQQGPGRIRAGDGDFRHAVRNPGRLVGDRFHHGGPRATGLPLRKGIPLLLAHGARSPSARRPRAAGRASQQRMTSQEDYDKASSQLENLRETLGELLSCGVVASKDELNGCNVTGWDAGRIVFLARACCEMGYLTEGEAWAYIGRADALAHEACGSWRELAMSYILGAFALGRQTGLQFGDEDDGRRTAEQPQEPVGALPVVRTRRNSDESRAEIPGLLPRPRGAHGLCLLAGGERDDSPAVRRGRRLGRAGGWSTLPDDSTRSAVAEIDQSAHSRIDQPIGAPSATTPTLGRRRFRLSAPGATGVDRREYPRSGVVPGGVLAQYRRLPAGGPCRFFEGWHGCSAAAPRRALYPTRSCAAFSPWPLVVGLVIWLLARYT